MPVTRVHSFPKRFEFRNHSNPNETSPLVIDLERGLILDEATRPHVIYQFDPESETDVGYLEEIGKMFLEAASSAKHHYLSNV